MAQSRLLLSMGLAWKFQKRTRPPDRLRPGMPADISNRSFRQPVLTARLLSPVAAADIEGMIAAWLALLCGDARTAASVTIECT
jgi:hypothetical protein